jgi:hypothetical protein
VKEEAEVEKLLEMARRVADQAEVFSIQDEADGASFENARLKDIESKDQSGIARNFCRMPSILSKAELKLPLISR